MTRLEGLVEELAFWDGVMWTGGDWPDDWMARLDPETPLQDEFINLLGGGDLYGARILDVGAGPASTVGKHRSVELTAIDPLGYEYALLLEKHGIVVPVQTQPIAGEDLHRHFPKDYFDIAHARNSLDHSEWPLQTIYNMLEVTKPGGHVVLLHSNREADKQGWKGLHKWNFYRSGDGYFIEGKGERTDVVTTFADRANIWLYDEGPDWVRVVMRKW